MATAVEQWESRTGDVSSDRDGFSGSREFVVTIDNIGDNPDDILRDPDATVGVGADAVPFGSPHPTRLGLFSAFYVVQRPRIASFKYRVFIIYAPPLVFDTSDFPWELNYQPGLSSAIVRHDWFGVPIGPARYAIFDPTNPPPNPLETPIFHVTVPATKDKQSEILDLILDRGDPTNTLVLEPAFLTDVQRTEPAGSFSMTDVFPQLNTGIMANIVMLSNIINRTTFMGFPPRTVKFVGPSATAGQMVLPGQGQTTGFAWRVTLVFEWNSLGYRYRAQDVFETDGLQLPVVAPDGGPELREWQLYPEGDLNVIPLIVQQFGSSSGQNLGLVERRGLANPVPVRRGP